jgi:hypothetical protein
MTRRQVRSAAVELGPERRIRTLRNARLSVPALDRPNISSTVIWGQSHYAQVFDDNRELPLALAELFLRSNEVADTSRSLTKMSGHGAIHAAH